MQIHNLNQKGNALWFILIAIALLGILTATLSRTGGNNKETGDYERAQVAADDIMNFAKSIQVAVQFLQERGCSENEISFWHDSDGNGVEGPGDHFYNPDSPADQSCHIYQPEGAGQTYAEIRGAYYRSTNFPPLLNFTAANGVLEVGGDDASQRELILHANGIADNICGAINRSVGVTDIPDNGNAFVPQDHFDGSFPTTGSGYINAVALTGKTTGCFYSTTSTMNQNVFYHVLISR